MSVELTGSGTLKNLMRAFAGESQARNRYTFAASLCRQQKLPVLEAVFLFTAGQEKEHAEIFYRHMKPAAGRTVSIDGGYPVDQTAAVAQLLRRAQHNEYEEFDPVYPAFAETAQAEGFAEIAASFRNIAPSSRPTAAASAISRTCWRGKSSSCPTRCAAGCASTAATSTRARRRRSTARCAGTSRGISSVWSWPPGAAPGCWGGEEAMAYVDPNLRPRLESLSPELRAAILARNVPLRTLGDLIGVLEGIVAEAEGNP